MKSHFDKFRFAMAGCVVWVINILLGGKRPLHLLERTLDRILS